MSAKDKVTQADAIKLQSKTQKVANIPNGTADQEKYAPNWRKGNFKDD